jgi:predicted O-methyltransferase YrrM
LEQVVVEYYERRAPEYDHVYEKPERQADLKALRALLREAFKGRSVLEVAAGTGYWSEVIAPRAAHLLMTDVNPGPLAIAGRRNFGSTPVKIALADAFSLQGVPPGFDGAFLGFWWSHMPVQSIGGFLETLTEHMTPKAKVIAIDNRFVEGSSAPISRRDEQGNTFQLRRLEDGSTFEVLKNFPSAQELERAVAPLAAISGVRELTFYWILEFSLR